LTGIKQTQACLAWRSLPLTGVEIIAASMRRADERATSRNGKMMNSLKRRHADQQPLSVEAIRGSWLAVGEMSGKPPLRHYPEAARRQLLSTRSVSAAQPAVTHEPLARLEFCWGFIRSGWRIEGSADGHFWHDEVLKPNIITPAHECYRTRPDHATLERHSA
jgi:hypothetical protein